MTDFKHDLAALRIEREPERSGGAGRWIVWIALLILLSAGGFAGWRWFTRERPVEVQVASVSMRAAGTQAAVLNASGYVTARRRATVSSKITGKVIEVNVEEGMAVHEGQVLARLDDSNGRAALALAEAQAEAARRSFQESEVRLAEARITLGRRVQLVKKGSSRQRIWIRRKPRWTRWGRASLPAASRFGWRSARSRSNRQIWTTRSSARRSPAWPSPRMRNPAKWSRRSPRVVALLGPAFPQSSTCDLSKSRST